MELFRALGALLEAPCPESRMIGHLLELGSVPDEPTHSDLFLFQLYPYASVYLNDDGGLGGEGRDRIAGFWRALDDDPPEESDHLSTLLSTYARLIEAEDAASGSGDAASWRRVRHAFLWEHLLSWVLPFLIKLREIEPGFYGAWADTLEAALAKESALLGPPSRTPLALRAVPGLDDPRDSVCEGFLASILAPIRSGVVLTRRDLARAARDLGLGLRVGERAYILEAMFSQGPCRTLEWLVREADRWVRLHDRAGLTAPEVADFWTERARRTCALLGELRDDARREPGVIASGGANGRRFGP